MKKFKDYLYKLVIIILLVIISISGFQLYKSLAKYYKARTQYNNTAQIAGSTKTSGIYTGELDWDSLKAQNSDVRAWVYLDGTIINYPIVRGSDNSFYLTHMFNKAYSGAGTFFMDANAPDNFETFNTVVYGHHMRDGSMLALIEKYYSQEFYEEHKQLELITPNAKYHLKVIGFELVYSTSDAYNYNFSNDKEKQALLDFTAKNNVINTSDQATVKDKLVTFSTCAYEANGDRYVLVTKMVPWTEEELEAAKKEEENKAKLAMNEAKKNSKGNGDKSNSDKSGRRFFQTVKIGFDIFKESLSR